jgi:hypothetical protein
MNKVVVASLLALSAVALAPGSRVAFAQNQVNLGTGAQGGAIEMPAAEANAYNNAITQTDPKAKAAALEAYLTQYPQSVVKESVLQQLMQAYSQFDPTKALDAADRLLQVNPNNIGAMAIEAYFRKVSADTLTDPAAKQAALDAAAGYAQKGLAATKPKEMSDADFKTLKDGMAPGFYSTIANDALSKKDTATAITNFKSELASVPVDQTTKPGTLLQDTYTLATAYYQSTPPDLINCAWYAARAATFAPEPYKSQMMPLAKYCFRKYHGADDGFDALVAAAQANLNPPADFAIKPAPKPADIVKQVIATTPDLATLAISDKEFILQNGAPEDAAKVWDTIKGKSNQFPDVLVIAATESSIQAAISDDAVQSKTADFTFQMKEPLKTVPTVGSKITISGTYASFTPSPIMITMSDAEIAAPKAPAKKPAPVHHTTHK